MNATELFDTTNTPETVTGHRSAGSMKAADLVNYVRERTTDQPVSQDSDTDDREEAEDAHEAAILEQEQREEASYTGPAYVIEDPLTGSIIGHSPAKVSRTSGTNDLSLF